MNRFVLFTITAAAAAWGQSTLSPPQIGFIEDAAQAIRPAYGVLGNFALGKASAGTAVSFASSGSFQLMKTESAIRALGQAGEMLASVNASAGPALFAFSQAGAPVFAYVADAGELFQWSGGTFRAVPFNSSSLGDGAVVSVASPDTSHAAFLVERGADLWDLRVSLARGGVDSQSALTGVKAPALMLPSGSVVYATNLSHGKSPATQSIVIRRSDGTELEFPTELPLGFSLQQMGDGWVHLRGPAGGAQFAIRTTPGREGVYRLPEAQP